MDRQLLEDMIEDLEQAKRLIERRLRALYAMGVSVGITSDAPVGRGSIDRNDLKIEIERQRQAIMAQVEQVKAQAMATVNASHSGNSMFGGMSGGMFGQGMPHFGEGMPEPGSFDPEKLKELRQKIAESGGKK